MKTCIHVEFLFCLNLERGFNTAHGTTCYSMCGKPDAGENEMVFILLFSFFSHPSLQLETLRAVVRMTTCELGFEAQKFLCIRR